MAHKGHPVCEYTSKAKCEAARRIAIGQCVSMISEEKQCPHWGTDSVDGKGYCGQHIGTIYRAEWIAHRAAEAKAEIDARVNAYLKQTGQVAHVCGPRCEFTSIPLTG